MFVIPMVGLSSRFRKAGYARPKYELMLEHHTVFSLVVLSFKKYFKSDVFVFVVRKDVNGRDFVLKEVQKLGIEKFIIDEVDGDTAGQADSVFRAVSDLQSDHLYIFNIDTFRPEFVKPELDKGISGWLEVFKGEGDGWSFIEPGENCSVLRTTEKERISEYCSDGLYYFRSTQLFNDTFISMKENDDRAKGEFYVAPMFNYLIQSHERVSFNLIDRDQVIFCGVPSEYESCVAGSATLIKKLV